MVILLRAIAKLSLNKNLDFQPFPRNMAQYLITSYSTFRLFLNPNMIISSVKTRAEEFKLPDAAIQGMVSEL